MLGSEIDSGAIRAERCFPSPSFLATQDALNLMNLRVLNLLCLLTLMISLGAVSGCGPSHPRTYQVTGTVKLDDGTPITSGTIEFESLESDPPITATGLLDDQGRFELGTFENDDGALPGKHRVAVISNYEIGTGAERPGKIPKMVAVDDRYQDFSTSGLTFTVEETSNTFNLVLEQASAKQ